MSENSSRRHFLKASLTLIPAVTMVSGSVFASTHDEEKVSAERLLTAGSKRYAPRFFSESEWVFINAATMQLIPEDDLGPGAIACGVPEFIDRQMETPYAFGALWYMEGPFYPDQAPEFGHQQKLTPRDIYRFGIEACESWCLQAKGQNFSSLSNDEQIKVLMSLESDAVAMKEMKSSLFFSQLLKNSKEGYFADPRYGGNRQLAGWKMIGFPGARADFMDWVDHPNERYPLGAVSIEGERS